MLHTAPVGLWRRLRHLLGDGPSRPGLPQEVQALLARYQGPEPERVRHAIITLAGRDAHLLERWLEAARLDYRDVLHCEQQARTGRSAPRVDVERLSAWFKTDAPDATIADPPGRHSVVLVRVGAAGPEVLKAVRAASGHGLADVAALIERAPVTIVTGVSEEDAVKVASGLRALGATVEVQ